MLKKRPAVTSTAVLLALSYGGLFSTTEVQAQHTPDPYNIVGEYNSQYEPYMFATEPSPDSLIPNQARLRDRAGYRSANRFQSYIDSLDGVDSDLESRGSSRRSAGAGSPYYRAFRKFDENFDRIYRPNAAKDDQFFADRESREKRYFQALRETDQKKRAQLLREYNLEKLHATRSLSTTRGAALKGDETTRPTSRVSDPPADDLNDETAPPRPNPLGGLSRQRPGSIVPPAARNLPSGSSRAPSRPPTLPSLRAPGRRGDSLPATSGSSTTRARDESPTSILERSEEMERADPPLAPRRSLSIPLRAPATPR